MYVHFIYELYQHSNQKTNRIIFEFFLGLKIINISGYNVKHIVVFCDSKLNDVDYGLITYLNLMCSLIVYYF